MRTVGDIYEQYRIMPGLQLHQLRVAAVAKIVTESFEGHIDRRSVVMAALFHDMGNIVKFDLSRFPEFFGKEGRAYWTAVKKEFTTRYGTSSHAANVAIAKELGLSNDVRTLIDFVSVSRLSEMLDNGTFEQKITEYSDLRVGPYGVLSVEERFLDGMERYAYRYPDKETARKQYEEYSRLGEELERQIFARTSSAPEAITDEAVQPIIEELKHFQVD